MLEMGNTLIRIKKKVVDNTDLVTKLSTEYLIIENDTFSAEYVSCLHENILRSSYLSVNQLSESFKHTQGFSLIFKRSEIDRLKERFFFFG